MPSYICSEFGFIVHDDRGDHKFFDVDIDKLNDDTVEITVVEKKSFINSQGSRINQFFSCEHGLIRYVGKYNTFMCIFDFHKGDCCYLYDIEEITKKIISSKLFSGKYNPESSIQFNYISELQK